MVEQTRYKDRPAIAVKGERLTAVFLPEDGGKLASLRDESREYLAQAPGVQYRRLTPEGEYVPSECSGFDDMFPTIDPYTPDSGLHPGKTYPDHGEVCRYPMEVNLSEETLELTFRSRLFEVGFQKRICPEEGGIAIHYRLENRGTEVFPYIWAAHCMLQAQPDAQIVFPYPKDAPVRNMFGRQLSKIQTQPFSPDGESYKYYFTEPIPEGWCGYRYADGKTLMLRYPGEIVGYLGIWINNGSFKYMYNIALEPCTAPYDRPDAAMREGCCSCLQPGQVLEFRLLLTVEEGDDHEGIC